MYRYKNYSARSVCSYLQKQGADYQEYLQKRAALIDLEKTGGVEHGNPINSTDTVYLTTADKEGNACSFIASNYAGKLIHLGRVFTR